MLSILREEATYMSDWNVRPGEPISVEELRNRARALVKELLFWNMVITMNPEKRKARDRMIELRLEVQDLLETLAPGWGDA